MKCTFNNLSEQYQQIYVTFDKSETEEIFVEIESSLNKNSLAKFHSDDTFFKEKFYEKVIEIIEEGLIEEDIIIMSERIYNILSVIKRDKPLIVSVTYCIYDESFDLLKSALKIEKAKLPKLTEDEIKEIIDLIMMQKGYYQLIKTDIVKEECEVGFEKLESSHILEEVIYPNEYNIDLYQTFLGKKVGDEIEYQKQKFKITSIRKRKLLELDDKIASLIDPWGAKSAYSFIKNIKEAEQFYLDVNNTIKILIDMILAKKIIVWDNYTLNHYDELSKTPKYRTFGQPIVKVNNNSRYELLTSLTEQRLCAYAMSSNNAIHFKIDEKVKKIKELYLLKYGITKALDDANVIAYSQAIKILVYEFLEDSLIVV
ncbi:MAG: hypothetical protein ACOX4W_05945 [Bacilli bacterium]